MLATKDVTIRVNYSNDRAVRRRVLTFERKARFFSPAPENQFADARSRSIDGNQRLSLRRQIFVEGLNNEKFAMPKRIVLDRSHDCADYACELHIKLVRSLECRVWSPNADIDI